MFNHSAYILHDANLDVKDTHLTASSGLPLVSGGTLDDPCLHDEV